MSDCLNKTQKKKIKVKKNVGKWTRSEHQKFMDLIQKYGRNWVKFQQKIKTRTSQQIRSHAQKVFMMMSREDLDAFIGSQQEPSENQKNSSMYEKKKRKYRDQKTENQKNIDQSQNQNIKVQEGILIKEEIEEKIKIQELPKNNEHKIAVVKEINQQPIIYKEFQNQQVLNLMLKNAIQERQRLLNEALKFSYMNLFYRPFM